MKHLSLLKLILSNLSEKFTTTRKSLPNVSSHLQSLKGSEELGLPVKGMWDRPLQDTPSLDKGGRIFPYVTIECSPTGLFRLQSR